MDPLAKEIETYKNKLPEISGDAGKFVLISDDSIIGMYDSYQDALKAGYDKIGLKPFLVRRISSVETFSFFTREINAPPSAFPVTSGTHS